MVKYNINVLIVVRPNIVQLLYNILMAKLGQKNNFSERSLGVRCIVKGIEHLLDSDDFIPLPVYCLSDNPVGALPELGDDFVLLEDMRLYFFGFTHVNAAL